MIKKQRQGGQILLIVVLVTVVALTIGLALVSRSLINLRITKQNEQSQQALQAAEAGIEQALKRFIKKESGVNIPPKTFLNNATYDADINVNSDLVSGQNLLLNGGSDVVQDKGIDVWLSSYPNFTAKLQSVSLDIHWAEATQTSCAPGAGATTLPAIEVLLITGNENSPTLTKYVYEANTCIASNRIEGARASGNDASPPIGGVQFTKVVTVPPAGIIPPTFSDGILMKIIPLFNSTKIGVTKGGAGFPNQGALITSTGTSGEAVRKIQYFYSYPQIPVELLPYALISQ